MILFLSTKLRKELVHQIIFIFICQFYLFWIHFNFLFFCWWFSYIYIHLHKYTRMCDNKNENRNQILVHPKPGKVSWVQKMEQKRQKWSLASRFRKTLFKWPLLKPEFIILLTFELRFWSFTKTIKFSSIHFCWQMSVIITTIINVFVELTMIAF